METTKRKTLSQWLAEVNREVERRIGLSYLDLPDIDYAGMFEDGVSAKRAAATAIRGARE